MKGKFITLLAAVALVAFAAPSVASANTPTLFDHTGQVVNNAKILMTSTNWTWSTSVGNLKCAKVTITTKVTQNVSGTVKGISEGAGFGTTCDVGGNPIPVTDITVAEIHSAAAGSGTLNLTYKVTHPGDITCHFAAAGLAFHYAVGVTNDTIQITNGNLVGTPPACEPGVLNATVTLETDVSPFAPVWFQ